MDVDRSLQIKILSKLRDVFPLPWDTVFGQRENPEFVSNIKYLMGHGLVSAKESIADGVYIIKYPEITSRGIDFLKDDGGLSAILGVVTVKLHADTITSLVESKIIASPLPKEEKSALLKALQSAPTAIVGELAKRLTSLALDQAPGALQLLQNILLEGL